MERGRTAGARKAHAAAPASRRPPQARHSGVAASRRRVCRLPVSRTGVASRCRQCRRGGRRCRKTAAAVTMYARAPHARPALRRPLVRRAARPPAAAAVAAATLPGRPTPIANTATPATAQRHRWPPHLRSTCAATPREHWWNERPPPPPPSVGDSGLVGVTRACALAPSAWYQHRRLRLGDRSGSKDVALKLNGSNQGSDRGFKQGRIQPETPVAGDILAADMLAVCTLGGDTLAGDMLAGTPGRVGGGGHAWPTALLQYMTCDATPFAAKLPPHPPHTQAPPT
eukprot:359097-Chlamydomonas_euryale.AAC.4